MATPATISIKENTKGLVITVDSGGFVMTGFTATLNLLLEVNPGATPPSPVSRTLAVALNGLTATYTTTGSEFTGAPGFYDAELKVTDAGSTLYSLTIPRYLFVQPNIA